MADVASHIVVECVLEINETAIITQRTKLISLGLSCMQKSPLCNSKFKRRQIQIGFAIFTGQQRAFRLYVLPLFVDAVSFRSALRW